VDQCDIILVAAAGAVGKTTLARQISEETTALYVDLAEAEPVGGNTLSGGLAKSGIFDDWQANRTTVLIDGLDEARLKVTQPAFEAFLLDIADISAGRRVPSVLFGRTGAIEEAWLILSDRAKICVLEIGYYGSEAAKEFACAHLSVSKSMSQHRAKDEEAVALILSRLREDTSSDGDRFAGYAPVLMAVANRVAGEPNSSALIARIEKGDQPITLGGIVDSILEREQQKLKSISFQEPHLRNSLYSAQEQLQRLAAHIYRTGEPPLPSMSPSDAEAYANALASWVPEHPFLDGNVNAASAVFGAAIAAHALRNGKSRAAALKNELARGSAANPFLSEFYLKNVVNEDLPPEHVGIIYASIRARLSLGDQASLVVEGAENEDELESLRSEIEISVNRPDADRPRVLQFSSEQAGVIRFGNHLEDADINAPQAHVEFGGYGQEVVLIAPINIQSNKLTVGGLRLIAESTVDQQHPSIYLEASEANVSSITTPPILNGGVQLSVSWPGASSYPWTSYSVAPATSDDPRIAEALRRFRKFVISFRSHSKGSLKRYAAKIEHERMTKGLGKVILNHMISTGILSNDGKMYTLHSQTLSDVAGVSYGMCMAWDFRDRAIEFVRRAFPDRDDEQ
jgi:hypothetical protein